MICLLLLRRYPTKQTAAPTDGWHDNHHGYSMIYLPRSGHSCHPTSEHVCTLINRIPGTVTDMQPVNYWLHCRPKISRDIVSQIEYCTILESPALWLEDHLFRFQWSLVHEGLPPVWCPMEERYFVQKTLPSFYRTFYCSFYCSSS